MASEVVTKIQFRRGPETDRTNITNLGVGEPIFSLDSSNTGKFFIGDGSTTGGLGIKELCHNPTAPGVVDLAEGQLSFTNGILTGYTPRVTEPCSDGIPGIDTTTDTSSTSQFVQEIYTNISTNYQTDVSVLVRAIKYVNGVVTEIQNGPGVLLQNRTGMTGDYTILKNDSKFTSKRDSKSSTWFITVNDSSVTLGKEATWMYLQSLTPGDGNSRVHNEWVYVTDSGWTCAQSAVNDGIWIWFDSIKQWGYTSMSLYPFIYMKYKSGGAPGTGDIINRGQDDWTYVDIDSASPGGPLFYYNFNDSTWYNASSTGTAPVTTPTEPSNQTPPTAGLDQSSAAPTAPTTTP
jgi:hypothetical protein